MARTGRPSKLTDAMAAEIARLAHRGLDSTAVAHHVGVSRQTIYRWRQAGALPALGVPPKSDGPASCAHCSASFVSRNRRVCCSDTCTRARASAKALTMYHLATTTGRVREGMAHFRTLVGYLADRDGNTCGICTEPVDTRLPSGPQGNPLGPSLDHVIPRSQNGPDTLANLRLTHWACNHQRGNRGGNEQLRLVG